MSVCEQSRDNAPTDPGLRQPPSADEVRAQLDHLLSSGAFQTSDKRQAFLRFVVEETLAGRASRLKGYAIAVAALDRNESFDPHSDPVVRLEARRLRRDLDSYYIGAGRHDAVRISIPKGAYVPKFEWQDANTNDAEEKDEGGRPSGTASTTQGLNDAARVLRRATLAPRGYLAATVLAAVLALLVAANWGLFTGEQYHPADDPPHGPAVIVLPLKAVGSPPYSDELASGLVQEMISQLIRFPGFRVYALPADFEEHQALGLTKLGIEPQMAYVARGSVVFGADNVHLNIQLLQAASRQVVWSRSFDHGFNQEDLVTAQTQLAGEVASAIGQPYGAINADVEVRLARSASLGRQSYLCVLRAYDYRRRFDRQKHDGVRVCLEDAVRRDPTYGDAWAMLGFLLLDAGRIGYGGEKKRPQNYSEALHAASHAVRLEPSNTTALKALAAARYYLGDYAESERLARRAVELNPHDPEALAQFGWRLAARGNFREGIPLLKQAIARSVKPPGWYYSLIAIDLFQKGQFEQMLAVAERSAADGRGVSQMLIAIAAGELGNSGRARRALALMAEHQDLARDPAAYLRRHGLIVTIIAELMASLKKAERLASRSLTGAGAP